MGQLAISLHRDADHPTSEVVRWLKGRGWSIISMANGARMASPEWDQRGIFDLMDAVLHEIVHETHHSPKLPKPLSGKERARREPADDEDAFK